MQRNYGIRSRHPYQPVTWAMRRADFMALRSVRIGMMCAAFLAGMLLIVAFAHAETCRFTNDGHAICGDRHAARLSRAHFRRGVSEHVVRHVRRRAALDSNGNRVDPRPSRWCGWWLRQYLGVRNRAFNLARNWAHYGERAHGPAVGTIVVWPHHVGVIVGGQPRHWVIKSGNDGHRVRERVRSVQGAIAFRWPS